MVFDFFDPPARAADWRVEAWGVLSSSERKRMEARKLLDEAINCVAEAFGNSSSSPPKVLVLGCGLSPLVFTLADRLPFVKTGCMELSPTLLESLEAMAWSLPRRPQFFVQADITDLRRRRGRDHQVLSPGSFDVLVDENVLDGLACRFPAQRGLESLREARGTSVDSFQTWSPSF
ncbi:unnamed protein product [Durusdinium trenchii]|uniref:Uncharacterized protein n=1 Tax=Durusdinium trenchii TaxID=1381693 RepID=A0ABP0HCI4_9DINO